MSINREYIGRTGRIGLDTVLKERKKSDNPLTILLTNSNSIRILKSMLIELLRAQIKTCGKSLNQLGKDAKVDKAVLCRISQGGSCKAETVEALLTYFKFEIVRKKDKAKKGR
jgi:hypothetical protein